MAKKLGHRLQPYRPGLVGIEYKSDWHSANIGRQFKQTRVKIFDGQKLIGSTKGLLECERWGLGGGAISNATRIIARTQPKNCVMEISFDQRQPPLLIKHLKTRPLKEAMVTVGGVDLHEVNPQTMESKRTPSLYFAGEVLDIDGPTGGYNLTAAFATARLAVSAIARTGSFKKPEIKSSFKKNRGNKRYLNNRKSTTGGRFRRNRKTY
jgi:predicted flavoprotein YhiN